MATKTGSDHVTGLETLLSEARAQADTLRAEVAQLRTVIDSTRLIMGHELKKPATAISGYLDLALDDLATDGEVHELIKKARRECDMLNELNTFFLELLKSSEVDQRLHEGRTNVVALIERVVDHMPGHLNAASRVHLNAGEEVNSFRVNENALKIVVNNLVANALAYNEGMVTVEVEQRRDKRGMSKRDLLMIRVSDQGSGIPPQHLHEIFNPFVRLPNATASDGSGLGLTLVRSLADLCDGQVYIESEDGKGTTVHVTLPEIVDPRTLVE